MRNVDEIKIDKKLGAILTKLRIAQGLTQQEAANKIGITYQQLHKYEKAHNRVSVSRLCSLAEAYNVSAYSIIEFMFKDDDSKPIDRRPLLIAGKIAKMPTSLIVAFDKLVEAVVK